MARQLPAQADLWDADTLRTEAGAGGQRVAVMPWLFDSAKVAAEESVVVYDAIRRRTIDGTNNKAVRGAARARNNGRYNGDGREWETPPEVFKPLHAEFDFTLDPCSTISNAKCRQFYIEHDNGLARDWGHERVFMNPPYGREIYAWTRKARESAATGALVVGLLPASTDLAWWHEDVLGVGAEVRYIRGRVRFLTGGPYRASGFFPSVVVVWRPKSWKP